MPWLETDVRDQRIQFILAARRPGAQITAICRAFGISRKTGYKWLARERRAHSVAALGDQSRRPHHSPTRTSARLTARVIALRREYGWGGEKLAWVLAAEGCMVSARTVDRIIQREGLTRTDVAPTAALRRFTREAPNDLWQMDAKGAYPLQPGGRCHPLSIVDDHSRFAVGLVALATIDTEGVHGALVQCFRRYGVPVAMLMDHGTPWWASASHDGVTRLSVFLLNYRVFAELTLPALRDGANNEPNPNCGQRRLFPWPRPRSAATAQIVSSPNFRANTQFSRARSAQPVA